MLKFLTSFKGAVLHVIAISSLLVTSACTQQTAGNNGSAVAANSNSSQVTAPANTMAEMDHGNHNSSPPESAQNKIIATLNAPKNIQAKTSTPLAIDIRGTDGQPINKFETFQEKLMHLIIVSDDLQFFSHLHPEYKQNGRFVVSASFPSGGSYTLVSDYHPTGHKEQVSIMKTTVKGIAQTSTNIELARIKTIGDITATLKSVPGSLKVGEEVSLAFSLQQKNGQPIAGLQPYLGEKGHLVIIKQSSAITKADYIHAHAMPDGQESEIVFKTKFSQPGKYKMWGQFNHNGKIVITDFWVNVS